MYTDEKSQHAYYANGGMGVVNECDDPHCHCHDFARKRYPSEPSNNMCILGQPLWMVIPAGGIHLPCPVHGKHFIPSNNITC